MTDVNFTLCPKCASPRVTRQTKTLDAMETIGCRKCGHTGTGVSVAEAYLNFIGYDRAEPPMECPSCLYKFRDGPEPSVVGVVRFPLGFVCRNCKQVFTGICKW